MKNKTVRKTSSLFDRLDQAFRNTHYEVHTDTGHITIRIGQCPPFPRDWPAMKSWAFLTAWNPLSKPLPREENRRRNAQLLAAIEKWNWKALPGVGVSPDGSWREESFFIFHIRKQQARALAERFGQLAFVYGEGDGIAELIYIQSKVEKKSY